MTKYPNEVHLSDATRSYLLRRLNDASKVDEFEERFRYLLPALVGAAAGATGPSPKQWERVAKLATDLARNLEQIRNNLGAADGEWIDQDVARLRGLAREGFRNAVYGHAMAPARKERSDAKGGAMAAFGWSVLIKFLCNNGFRYGNSSTSPVFKALEMAAVDYGIREKTGSPRETLRSKMKKLVSVPAIDDSRWCAEMGVGDAPAGPFDSMVKNLTRPEAAAG